MTGFITWVADQLWFLFGIDIGLASDNRWIFKGHKGVMTPTLRDVVRNDSGMLMAFLFLIGLIARALYLFIAPQSIFDIRYVLAVLYSLYGIGIAVLVFQAVRDIDAFPTLNLKLRETWPPTAEKCSICLEDSAPPDDIVQLHCSGDEDSGRNPNRSLHMVHMSCYRHLIAFRLVDRVDPPSATRCPICRSPPKGFRRIYGPPNPSPLDFSTLMWYIHSLYIRRMQVTSTIPVWGFVSARPLPITSPFTPPIIVYSKALMQVQIAHMAMLTRLIIFARLAYVTCLTFANHAPSASWATLIAAFVFTLLVFFCIATMHRSVFARGNAKGFLHMFMAELVQVCNYLSPRLAPMPGVNRPAVPRRQFLLARGSTLVRFAFGFLNLIIRLLLSPLGHVIILIPCLYAFDKLTN